MVTTMTELTAEMVRIDHINLETAKGKSAPAPIDTKGNINKMLM
jgi:hypothetical protein